MIAKYNVACGLAGIANSVVERTTPRAASQQLAALSFEGKIMQRTLSEEVPGQLAQQVHIQGHVQTVRKLGNLAFLVVRDRSGSVQVVVESPELLPIAEMLQCETPIRVTGQVMPHPSQKAAVELRATSLTVLSTPVAALPVEVSKTKKMDALSLSTLLDYRPLTLRNEKVRAIFKIEAVLCEGFRQFLSGSGFTEIHSPKIVATGTEGGAQLFPVQYFGKTAYLAQSPQFYKQMMVGVFERVFEIGPVYRAEEHDTTRHLNEYISMDVETGFISSEADLMELETHLLQHMFALLKEKCGRELELWNVCVPEIKTIPRLTLAQACSLLEQEYRWGLSGDSSSEQSRAAADLDPEGERLLCEHFKRETGSEMVFVTHYPWSVRPFYAMPEAGTVLSCSFDLLYRGLEITTGGQRIHEYDQLCQAMRSRGLEPEQFADYLQCFSYGMPPHGGFAIGLERLAKQLLGLPNVKQASLFPRDRNRISP
jgi:nondiscriminating aspartyl-tRNA synthetase